MPFYPARKPAAVGRLTPRCPGCGNQLLTQAERAESICHRLPCRGPWIQARTRAAAQRDRRQRDEFALRTRKYLQQQIPALVPGDSEPLLLILPRLDEPTAVQTPERRRRFTATLDQALASARLLASDPAKAEHLRIEFADRRHDLQSAVVVNACSTCRGNCCRQGHQHAFLTAEFLAWRLVTEPETTAQDLRADYLQRLPAESVNGSCLYHTRTGCALPRQLRGSTCNQFLCTGLADHRAEIQAAPDQPSIAVATENDHPLRVAVTEAAGIRTECEVTQPAAEPGD